MITKNNRIRRWVVSVILFTLHSSLFTTMAQDKPEVYIDAAIVSHYMWRGQDLGNVCLQPEIGVSWKGLELSLEGSTGFTRDEYEELDVHLFYNYKGFNIGVSDMWAESALDPRYFSYKSTQTGHQFEGQIGYECDYGSLTWRTIFAGNDYKINGKRAYSSWIELSVPFKLCNLDWDFRLGVCPYESAGATISYESEDELGNPITESYTDHEIPPEALEDATFAAMIGEAEKYLGFPYVWGGSNPDTSFDCSGFVSWVINQSGWDVGRLGAQGLYDICTPVSEPAPGDLVFFTGTYDAGVPVSHVGLYVGDGWMIHAGDPISYQNLSGSYYQSHFYAWGRLPVPGT